jgi:predicted ribosomally synthesized peptide with SipW-like signal peptide
VSPRNRFILLAGVVGAALGAAGAWAYLQSQENKLGLSARADGAPAEVQVGFGDFFRIGVALFGIVRQIQTMVERKEEA